jgi:hypothetical protein
VLFFSGVQKEEQWRIQENSLVGAKKYSLWKIYGYQDKYFSTNLSKYRGIFVKKSLIYVEF